MCLKIQQQQLTTNHSKNMKTKDIAIITKDEVAYIVSFMLNAARLELSNHVFYKHELEAEAPSGYFRDTYKHFELETDGDCFTALFKALSKHLKDNEELLMMYGRIDEDVVENAKG